MWKVFTFSGDIVSVKYLLPIRQWVWLTEHKAMDDQGFNVRKVAQYPKCVTTACGCGEYNAVFSHFLDSGEDDFFAEPQVLSDKVD